MGADQQRERGLQLGTPQHRRCNRQRRTRGRRQRRGSARRRPPCSALRPNQGLDSSLMMCQNQLESWSFQFGVYRSADRLSILPNCVGCTYIKAVSFLSGFFLLWLSMTLWRWSKYIFMFLSIETRNWIACHLPSFGLFQLSVSQRVPLPLQHSPNRIDFSTQRKTNQQNRKTKAERRKGSVDLRLFLRS